MSSLTIRGKVIAPYSPDVVPLSTEIRDDLEPALAFAGWNDSIVCYVRCPPFLSL